MMKSEQKKVRREREKKKKIRRKKWRSKRNKPILKDLRQVSHEARVKVVLPLLFLHDPGGVQQNVLGIHECAGLGCLLLCTPRLQEERGGDCKWL